MATATKFAMSEKQKRILSESRPIYQSTKLEEGLCVEPSTIKFDSVQPGTLYVMTFSVRNTSKVGQRIRLVHESKSGYFVLNYIPSGTVAPGLDIRGEVECRIPANSQEMTFMDRIVAIMGNQEVVIPLFACKPYAKIKFNHLIEFGAVVQGQAQTKEITFENVSDIRGSIKLNIPNESFLRITPSNFNLEPAGFGERSSVTVKFHVDGKDIGFFREVIKVNIAGALDDEILDVTAQVVEQKLTLLANDENGGILETANFGNIFFGEKKTITAVLINTGPHPLNYAMNYEDQDEENGLGSSSGGGGGGKDDPQSPDDNSAYR